ncbi:uncharacterized protein UTRI_00370_B [Ustilago trichophora]|uniref:F-box domain-containing protein n=1 Tax=Ustilago trichophora TaxID=86804 RepID=A0A5C3DSK5_9BASI|nr:uncharacterized protein UTRI_00370_B [Ustilago trichophora]
MRPLLGSTSWSVYPDQDSTAVTPRHVGVRGAINETSSFDSEPPSDALQRDNRKIVDQRGYGNLERSHAQDHGQISSHRARIETLPPELLLYLSRFLDLAGLVVLSTATCRSLRIIFDQFDRELLFLEPAHRLNLAEWREAARQIDGYLLTRSHDRLSSSVVGSTEKASPKAVMDISQTMHELTRDESLIDVDLLQAVLAFLAAGESRKLGCAIHAPSSTMASTATTTRPDVSRNAGISQIRCLYLTGWHGIAGAFLIQQLRLQPSLRDVCTVVKTDRADTRIWQQAAADDLKIGCRMKEEDAALTARLRSSASLSFEYPGSRVASIQTMAFDAGRQDQSSMVGFKQCTSTQIIVQVGKRRPRRPGQPYLRGEGLQMGYQGYCIDMMTKTDWDEGAADAPTTDSRVREELRGCSGAESEPEGRRAAGSGAGENAGADSVEEPSSLGSSCSSSSSSSSKHLVARSDATRKRLHVILQGREEIGAEAQNGKDIEEMFERSIVTCNHCKSRIKF